MIAIFPSSRRPIVVLVTSTLLYILTFEMASRGLALWYERYGGVPLSLVLIEQVTIPLVFGATTAWALKGMHWTSTAGVVLLPVVSLSVGLLLIFLDVGSIPSEYRQQYAFAAMIQIPAVAIGAFAYQLLLKKH